MIYQLHYTFSALAQASKEEMYVGELTLAILPHKNNLHKCDDLWTICADVDVHDQLMHLWLPPGSHSKYKRNGHHSLTWEGQVFGG